MTIELLQRSFLEGGLRHRIGRVGRHDIPAPLQRERAIRRVDLISPPLRSAPCPPRTPFPCRPSSGAVPGA
jgi:hypothetical protein